MRKIIAIVEGQTEEHFVRRTYPSCLVLRPFTNGRDVSTSLLAKKIAAPLARIGADYDDIVILIDRERRAITAEVFAEHLRGELETLCPGREFSIGVPDIHIENWILADEVEMRRRFKPDFLYQGDGTAAKNVLREISGVSHSPLAKAELLKACNSEEIARRSPSFDRFRGIVRCDWTWVKREAA